MSRTTLSSQNSDCISNSTEEIARVRGVDYRMQKVHLTSRRRDAVLGCEGAVNLDSPVAVWLWTEDEDVRDCEKDLFDCKEERWDTDCQIVVREL